MKIHVVYVVAGNIPGAPPGILYRPGFDRFVKTFSEFTEPTDRFDVVFVNSNGGMTDEMRAQIPFAFTEIEYNEIGWDIGAQQGAAEKLPPSDWMICFSSWGYFTKKGWIERYIKAIDLNMDSLYGSMSSMENGAHIRGTGYCCKIGSMLEYPNRSTTRDKSFGVESGPGSLTNFFQNKKDGAFMITWDGIYAYDFFRKPENIFRKGDQSNLINRDKHSLIYDEADEKEKIRLAHLSDTGIDTNCIK